MPALTDEAPLEIWLGLHRRLNHLLQQGEQATQFEARLQEIEAMAAQTLQAHPDDSLFVLVQMLFDPERGYSASHALLAAVTCQLVGTSLDWPAETVHAVTRAALTMNIAMTHLHDALAKQVQQTDEWQRQAIRQHPTEGARILQQLGMTDPLLLELVRQHHESPDGSGYPEGRTDLSEPQQLLHMADLFIARISPRKTRRGLSPKLAVGNLYLQAQTRSNRLATVFAKQLGLYPPGSFVRLKNEETAVVVRRGDKLTTPVVLSIADAVGMPLSAPARRDTLLPMYAVEKSVPAEEVRIRLDVTRLLKRV